VNRTGPARRSLLAGVCTIGIVIALITALYASSSRRASSSLSRQDRSGDSIPVVGSGPGAPTFGDVQKLLDRHASAVLSHDHSEFMADIDTGRAASQFRANQQASFDALADVPISSWKYSGLVPVTSPTSNANAAKLYRGPVLMVRVTFSYELRDADTEPSAHELWLTFVNRSGHARLAADADLVDSGGASWHGPWDFGPIEVDRGRYSLVLAHPLRADIMPVLARVLDSSVAAVTKAWGTRWDQQIALVVPDSQAEMNQVLENTLPLSQIAATTYVNGVDAGTGRPEGVRIAVNPANLVRLDAIGLRIVIQHEVTLVATWTNKSESSPIWLTEGFAEYVANLDTGQSVPFAAAELARQVRAGAVPAALPTAADFGSEQTRLPQAYEEAWLACRLIAQHAGQPGLVKLFRQVGASDAGAAAAVETALQSVLHTSTARFTLAWQQYLKAQLG
jgi:hypothetical protein